jgi:hypothetical protein
LQKVCLSVISNSNITNHSFSILFSTDPKEKIVLFVGNDNPAAKVYNRVGFVGLDKNKPAVEGVERWLEIGFDRRRVQQGHW